MLKQQNMGERGMKSKGQLRIAKLRVVKYACYPSTWEAEAGRSRVQGQPWLHSKILFQKTNINNFFLKKGQIIYKN
jgi:hypothetical protein